MHKIANVLLAGALAVAAPAAWGVMGKTVVVNPPEAIPAGVPVIVQHDGADVSGAVVVEDAATGQTFPATLRDGQLVFVADTLAAGAEHTFSVRARSQDAPPQVRIEEQEDAKALAVYVLDTHFVTYQYSDQYKKPFLWPVKGAGGIHLTRDWPMAEQEEAKSTDHVHQKSMWTAHGDLNGVDYWGEGGNSGRQRTDEVTYGSGDGYGWIRARNTWVDKDGTPVISEEREYRFYATPDTARVFDATITFTADHGDVKWGDTKEGGIMALRIRPAMEERNGGVITTNNGVGSRLNWGKPAAWCDYSGTPPESGVQGIAIMDHPQNFRHPVHWHVRDYGLNGANYFGYSDFYRTQEKSGDHMMASGETLTFNYRVYVHTGGAEEARVADHYTAYTKPAATAVKD
jgi:hypothetical protein